MPGKHEGARILLRMSLFHDSGLIGTQMLPDTWVYHAGAIFYNSR